MQNGQGVGVVEVWNQDAANKNKTKSKKTTSKERGKNKKGELGGVWIKGNGWGMVGLTIKKCPK